MNIKKHFDWGLIVLFCILFLTIFYLSGAYLPLENIFYDLRFKIRGPKKTLEKIVIIKIDEESLNAFGRWPWDRKILAKVVENLYNAGAKIVALDILFPEKSNETSDKELANALAKGNSIVASHFETTYENILLNDSIQQVCGEKLILPIPQIQNVAKVGFTNVEPDKDGVVRRIALQREYEGHLIYSFDYIIYKNYVDRDIKNLPEQIYINYYGPQEYFDKKSRSIISTFIRYSIVNIYNNIIPPSWIKDKIVLIGSTATGTYDHYPTPYASSYPGIEIHATIIENLLTNTYCKKKFTKLQFLAIIILMMCFLGFVFYITGAVLSVILILFLVFCYYFLTYFLFAKFYTIVEFIPIALGVVLLGFGSILYKLLFAQKEKKIIKKAFSKYINPYIMEELLKNPKGSLSTLGGQKKEITVAFADIRGFTTIAEHLPAEEVVRFLNECFSVLSNIIFKYNGTIDKYIGDCIMFFWNAPVEQPDHPYIAVNCVIEMFYALDRLVESYRLLSNFEVKMGAGINTGEVVVGNIGSANYMTYTVVGDTVNVASRLQDLTKEFYTPIIISEYTNARLNNRIPTVSLGKVKLRGREQEIEIFKIKL
jgi:adenylate cyclase